MNDDLGEWVRGLSGIPAVRVDVSYRCVAPLRSRDPINALVRGQWLARLRELWCVTGAQSCEACPWTATCGWGRWVEAPANVVARAGAHGSHAPHPAWLGGVPALRAMEPGYLGVARITLVGEACPAAHEWGDMLAEALASLGDRALEVAEPSLALITLGGAPERSPIWQIALETPVETRDVVAEDFAECPAAPWLVPVVRATVRRARALMRAYLPGGADESFRPPWPSLHEVRAHHDDVRRVELERSSHRQGRTMPIGGWVGGAVLEGEAMRSVGPLLAAGAAIGVGKKTLFGFGDLRVQPRDGVEVRATPAASPPRRRPQPAHAPSPRAHRPP